jgi:hypothetical protein
MKLRDTKESWHRMLRFYLRPKPRPGGGRHGLPEPVEPSSPKPLSGGSAAALEFDA